MGEFYGALIGERTPVSHKLFQKTEVKESVSNLCDEDQYNINMDETKFLHIYV